MHAGDIGIATADRVPRDGWTDEPPVLPDASLLSLGRSCVHLETGEGEITKEGRGYYPSKEG